MPTRRDILIGAAITGALAPMLSTFAKDSPKVATNLTPVNFKVPAGACDCHVHIVGDPKPFPMSTSRTYTPETAPVSGLQAMHRALHISRTVVAQISIYGADNACVLDALKQLGSSARGVAMIDDKTPDSDLDAMHKAGVRGVRLIFFQPSLEAPANLVEMRRHFQNTVERVKKRNWLVQVYARPVVIDGLKDEIMAAPVPVVLDHFAGVEASFGVGQPGFDGVLQLVKAGKAYVKISAPYRSSTQAPDFPDIVPFAKALIAANPQRILWASDWPHVDSAPAPGRKPADIVPGLPIDDGHIFNLLPTWVPDAATRKLILVENPGRLYFSS
ncbi:MAG TPA: amidohydrolase family protein [Terriglobales bacterium]|nr:amidohydrolase family protein [Terriglobales bacterium]